MKFWAKLLIFFCLMSFEAKSSESFSYEDQALVTYESNQKWVLDHFLIKPGHLQQRIENLKKLGIQFDPSKILKQSLIDIKALLDQRKTIVQEGHDFCLVNSCEEGSENYEIHSTPSRDKRLYQKFEATEKLLSSLVAFDPNLMQKWQQALERETFAVGGIIRSLSEWRTYLSYHLVSSHPEDTIAERWGLTIVDVKSSLQKNITRKLQLRNELVSANTCSSQPESCPFKSAEWKKFQTYDFDSTFLKLFEGYYYLCELSPIDCAEKVIPDSVRRLPFMVSEPTASLFERQGQQVDLNKMTFLPFSRSVKALGEDYYILDRGLYYAKENTYPLVGENVFFDEENKNVLSFSEKTLTVFNIKTQVSFSLEFKGALGSLDKVSKIASNTYLVENCTTLSREYQCDKYLISIENEMITVLKKFTITPSPSLDSNRESKILRKAPKMITTADLHHYVLFDHNGLVHTLETSEAATSVLETENYVYIVFDDELQVMSKNERKIIYSESFSFTINLLPTALEDTVILSIFKNDEQPFSRIIKMNANGVNDIFTFNGWLWKINNYDSTTFLEFLPHDQNSPLKYLIEESGVRELKQYANTTHIMGAFPWLGFMQNDFSNVKYENILTGEQRTLSGDKFFVFCQDVHLVTPKNCQSAKLDLAIKALIEMGANIVYNTYVYVDPNDPFKAKVNLFSFKVTQEEIHPVANESVDESVQNYINEGNLIQLTDKIYIHLK